MSRSIEPPPRPAVARRRGVPNLRAMSAALLVSLGMSALVILLHNWYPSRAFTFLYLPMVAVLAFVGGRGPGLLSALISLLGAWFILLGPARAASVDTGLIVFGITFAASTYGLSEAMVRLRRQSQASRDLAAIVESSDDAIYAKSLDAVILTWNRGA
jgi:K+-sensing histidine kinase KdpD